MLRVLKYIFKNLAFVCIFRGLLCLCASPVRLTSFTRQTFANYGKDLHFFPPTILSALPLDEGFAGLNPNVCVNSVAEVSSLALIPE